MTRSQKRLDDQTSNVSILIGNDDVPAVKAGIARTHCKTLDPGDIQGVAGSGGATTLNIPLFGPASYHPASVSALPGRFKYH
jgi:hypothetical protein